MEPEGSDRPAVPTGPYPTAGPGTVRMPRWPGPALIIGGGMLALAALSAAALAGGGEPSAEEALSLLGLAALGGVLFVAGLVYAAIRQIRVRRFLPPERYRGPAILILLVLALVSAGILTAPFSADAAALLVGEGELSLAGSIALLVSTQASLLAVSWLFVFRPRALVGWPSWAGPDPAGALRTGLGWGIPAWVGATVASVAVTLGLERLGIRVDPQAAERALLLVDPWLAIVAIVILAPLAEEVFFRGVVFNAWLRESGRRFAYVGSSALFAAIHLSLVAVLPIFLLGLALAWVYRRTGNLLAPIAMHMVVNGISVGLALVVRFELLPMPV